MSPNHIFLTVTKKTALSRRKKHAFSAKQHALFKEEVPLAKIVAARFWNNYFLYFQKIGFGYEDVAQEAVIGLINAVKKYKPDSHRPFAMIARTVIKNTLIDLLSYAKAKKRGRIPEVLDANKHLLVEPSLEIKTALNSAIQKIKTTERNRKILIDYFGLQDGIPKTYSLVATRFGMGSNRIYLIIKELKSRLRKDPALKDIAPQ